MAKQTTTKKAGQKKKPATRPKIKPAKLEAGANSATKTAGSRGTESAGLLRLVYMNAEDLAANPHNWRTHPSRQVEALSAAIAEVGWAGALLYNERTKRLIDGHARRELFVGKGPVPVLIGSWDEADEKKILATLDPLAALAQGDAVKLDALLRGVTTGNSSLQELLADLAAAEHVVPQLGASADEDAAGAAEEISERFAILVECEDEDRQRALLEKFEKEGIACRALVV